MNLEAMMSSPTIPTEYLYSNPTHIASLLTSITADSLDTIMLTVEANNGSLTHMHPKHLKADLINKIPHHTDIDFLKLTRNGKMILTTKSPTTAQEILQLQILLTTPVTVSVQTDSISTKFLLYNISPEVQYSDIAEEFADIGIIALEIHHFLKKNDNALRPFSNSHQQTWCSPSQRNKILVSTPPYIPLC